MKAWEEQRIRDMLPMARRIRVKRGGRVRVVYLDLGVVSPPLMPAIAELFMRTERARGFAVTTAPA